MVQMVQESPTVCAKYLIDTYESIYIIRQMTIRIDVLDRSYVEIGKIRQLFMVFPF